MSFIKKLFRRDSGDSAPTSEPSPAESPDLAEGEQLGDPSAPPSSKQGGVPRGDLVPTVAMPAPPGSGPAAHQQQSQFQNAGMAAGAVIGDVTGAGVGAGLVDGLIVGNIVGQRVQQAQKHAYWREQALNYRTGAPAAGVGDPRVAEAKIEGRDRERDRSGREERRRKRWERRAGRD